ncbi:acetyl-CoA carboxylase biotin carboxylase subunit [Methanosphaera sp.]|uniref:acetyl-CoA carboxylase biotin carboxylase subunit n=1 Tax=Methanosphaera sp. TaxID=2666342 RepID=UPI0025CFF57C|nr:acetyl-CoA carboxylase biotin carboxylase subunit [Methanosphaera sp.]MEE1118038.1 acetyl-CoA carboxylase biotin carboxylase subunit [Methanosphaera sp.]MEE3325481.1 acetyl-CoA carboxylase biotin carboxylase subunit [Methanosphaera sp.]
MFDKVLIANRGEIAIRVMRACKELDVDTVAIYSDTDETALFTKYADEAKPLNSSILAQSYLDIDKIMDIAIETGADAIHPGYGFLSENPVLGERCDENNITLIGPRKNAIESMGDKITSKQLMEKVGVPTVPGDKEGITDVEVAKKRAKEIGYPVIIKSSAGGGGIGMRVVYEEDELARAIETTQNLAQSTFGDGTVYIEKYIERPRHIEFQVLADNHGNTVHVCDRECSIQRRHQKLIEEAPSPIMTEELRERMGESAIKAAQSVDYNSAGTVEFMYSNGEYYFLEMNTRIQVEHPITEAITGIDLVKQQIKVAAGEKLGYEQDDIKVNGHAIECRINAEDPLNDFVPSPGKLLGYRSPGGIGIRMDSGVYTGYTIPSIYDSMIAKLIVHGNCRDEAIARMKRALNEFIVVGVPTTIPFHKALMNNKNFQEANLHTSFIEENKQDLIMEIERVVKEDEARISELNSTFLPSKKVAAISTSVNTYMQRIMEDQQKR